MATFDAAEFARQLEALRTAGASFDELSSKLRTLNAEQAEQVKNSSAATAQIEALADARRMELDSVVRSAEAQKQLADQRAAAAEASGDEARAIQARNKALEAQIELLKAQADAEPDPAARQATLDAIVAQEEAIRANNEELKEYNEQIAEADKKTKEFKDTLESMAKDLGKVGEAMFAGEDAGKQFMSAIGGIGKSAVSSIQNKLVASLGAFGPAAAGFVGVAAVAGAAILKLAIAMSDTSKEIQKATGVSDDFARSITSGFAEARKFGGTLKELSASAVELSKTFTDFTMLNASTAQSLAVTATMMSKLGVSNADFAKGIQLSTKALGATEKQAEQTQLNLAQLAMDIGVAPSQMAADFASAGPHLAKFGRDAEQAFKSLAITAKSTGIEVGRLLQITEKFDTFEGAAEQAGKLNAALGGNFVNSMELLTETDPTARFEMMTNAIKDAGLSFDDMSYYQRKFYADAMGLSDVSELALALSGNTAALGKEARMTAADYEEMAARAETVQNFQERLNVVFAEMIPIVEPLVDMLEGMVEFMADNTEVVKAFGVAFTVLGAGIALATLPISGTAMAITAVTAAIAGMMYYVFHKTNSPTFAKSFAHIAGQAEIMKGAMDSLRDPFGMLSGDIDTINDKMLHTDGLTANIKTSTKAMHQFDTATMKTAQTARASAPVLATSNAVSNAMSNYNSTTNTVNNNDNGATKVEIGLADGFSDMFSAKVVKSVAAEGFKGLI